MKPNASDELTAEQKILLARRLAARVSLGSRQNISDPGHSSEGYALSTSQYRMWLAEQNAGEPSSAYAVPIALRILGDLDVERLSQCLLALADRHAALRARISERHGVPRQFFDAPASFPLEYRSLSSEETQWSDVLEKEAARPFPLEQPPYARAVLFKSLPSEHILTLSFHHIVCDGFSLNIVVDELLTMYSQSGVPEITDSAPTQHREYAVWENSAEGKKSLSAHTTYWSTLAEFQPNEAEQLPFAQPALEVARRSSPPSAKVPIPEELVDKVETFARRHGTLAHSVWLAAFAATWHMSTGDRRVRIGVPASNRLDQKYDGAVGAFVGVMPLGLEVHPAMTFIELVDRATDSLLDGAEHPVLPINQSTSQQTPRAFFVFTAEDDRKRSVGPLEVEQLPLRIVGSQSDLTLNMVKRGNAVSGYLTGAISMYSSKQLNRLGRAYLQCIFNTIENPHVPLANFDLREIDQQQSIVQSNDPRATPPLAHNAFIGWVEQHPNNFATWDSDHGNLTYRQLETRSAEFMARLSASGVERGMGVALRLAAGVDYIALTLGVWRLGAWTIPLRRDDPTRRLEELLVISGASFLIHDDVKADFEVLPVKQLSVSEFTSGPQYGARKLTSVSVSRDAPAYAVFTSGTTGAPKCVLVSQSSLANELAWRRQEIELNPSDRVLQTIPLAFDPSFWQCFGALTAGAGVVLPVLDMGSRPRDIVDAAIQHSATIVDLVPSLLEALTDEDLAELPARIVFCGGEALSAFQARRYMTFGRGTLYNQYGPSEACIDATSHRLTDSSRDTGNVPIGSAITGVRLHILDSSLRPLPVGCTGEMYIAGAGLALGYVGQPRETAAHFLPEPGGSIGSRMYRTGDRAFMDEAGRLHFLGRNDDQVKIRGHRIELEEVGRALRSAPGVSAGAAFLNRQGVKRLIAAVVVGPGFNLTVLRKHLMQTLPVYMMPADVVVVDALPRTANGKVDRVALASLAESERLEVRKTIARDTDKDDHVLAAVLEAFETVLDMKDVLPEDNLYELGGASLGAARVAALLCNALNLEVPARTVLTHPVARKLALHLKSFSTSKPEKHTSENSQLNHAHRGNGPASEQLPVLEIERILGRATPAIPVLLKFDDTITEPAVEAALRQLVRRHDGLRPFQNDETETPWVPCTRELLPNPPARAYWSPELAQYGPADDVPGLSGVLLRGPDGTTRHLLLLIARNRADGPSAGLLAEEMSDVLTGHPLTTPAASYAEYSRRRQSQLTPQIGTLEAYWREALRAIDMDPFNAVRPRERGFMNDGVQHLLPAEQYQALQNKCQVDGITLMAPLLSALQELVRRHEGNGTFAVGVPVSHRLAPLYGSPVGRAVDLLPIALDSKGPIAAHGAMLSALDHSDLPFVRIASIGDPVDAQERPAVCSVGLVVHEGTQHPAILSDALPDNSLPMHWSDLDLVLHVQPAAGGGCRLILSGTRGMFDISQLRHWLVELSETLRNYVAEHGDPYLLKGTNVNQYMFDLAGNRIDKDTGNEQENLNYQQVLKSTEEY